MIPSRHFDHTVRVWGSQVTRGPEFSEPERQWSPVPGQDNVPMAIQTKRESVNDAGPGERVAGEYVAYGHAAVDVLEGEVIEVLSGPEFDSNPNCVRTLKVDSAYRPRGRHLQLVLIEWMGVL